MAITTTTPIDALKASMRDRNANLGSVQEAVEWYHRAAQKEHREAQLMLGLALLHGSGTEKNIEAAIGWIRKAADKGNAQALTELGRVYFGRHGVARDYLLSNT